MIYRDLFTGREEQAIWKTAAVRYQIASSKFGNILPPQHLPIGEFFHTAAYKNKMARSRVARFGRFECEGEK
jgi:hypothetical protein